MAYKIAIIVGSLRKDSLNRKVARSICALARRQSRLLDGRDRRPAALQPGSRRESARAMDALPRAGRAPPTACCSSAPNIIAAFPGVLKNAIDVGSRPYGQSVFDKKPAAIVTASPGSIGGFGANHQIRQAAVFLNMPMMQQPEAYLGHVSDDSFDDGGCLKDGPLKDLVTGLAHAFHDWVEMIHRSRRLLAEDVAHAAQQQPRNMPDTWRAVRADSVNQSQRSNGGGSRWNYLALERCQPQLLALLRIIDGAAVPRACDCRSCSHFPVAVPDVRARCRRC